MEDLLINHNEITLSKIESKLNETEEKFENLFENKDCSDMISKIFQKSFELRQNKKGIYREHAFILEEMAKHIYCKQDGLSLLYVDQEAEQQSQHQIQIVKNVRQLLKLLILLSGQTTYFDDYQLSENLTNFQSQYLKNILNKQDHEINLNEQNETIKQQNNVRQGVIECLKPNLNTQFFGKMINSQPNQISNDYNFEIDKNQQLGSVYTSPFFSVFNTFSFYNPSLKQSAENYDVRYQNNLMKIDSQHQQNQLHFMLKDQIKLKNRFNLSFFQKEDIAQSEQDIEPNFNFQSDTEQEDQFNQSYSNPFKMNQQLPLIPSFIQMMNVDPKLKASIRKRQESLNKNYDKKQNSKRDDFSSERNKKISSDLRVSPNSKQIQKWNNQNNKRLSKKALKFGIKQEYKIKSKNLLISLFPYVNEQKLSYNIQAESGIQNLWEDFNLDYQKNFLQINEFGLLTHQKQFSIQQMLENFHQNNLTDDENLKDQNCISESELVNKCLLLLLGIPSQGIFELDQETFTFSLYSNQNIYLITEENIENNQSQKVKTALNANLFLEMMEAGSYFLHLKEFVDCMQNISITKNNDVEPPGKILQAFSLSIADFLNSFQAQIINFQNSVNKRRVFEDILIFDKFQDSKLSFQEVFQNLNLEKSKSHSTILEILVHLDPLIQKLKLLASLCFTQRFINNIIKIKIEEQNQLQEQQNDAGFHKLLYSKAGEQKFTVKNLQIEFQQNLEKIRNQQWLEDFPRGAKLLSYLYQILMVCESDLQAVGLLRDIFSKSLQPLLDFISDFLHHGTFQDPFNEFFIEKIESSKQKQNKFQIINESHEAFILTQDRDKIPQFLGYQMAEAIFIIGTQINLLQKHDQFQLFQNFQDDHMKLYIFYVNDICNKKEDLTLTFSLPQINKKSSQQKTISQQQLQILQNLEQNIIKHEASHVKDLIAMKQISAQKFLIKMQQKKQEEFNKKQQSQLKQMADLKNSIEQKQEVERKLKEDKIKNEQEEREFNNKVEEIQKRIADELRKQYKRIVSDEIQVLGDARDWEIKENDINAKELDNLILIGEQRKLDIQIQIQLQQSINQNEQNQKIQLFELQNYQEDYNQPINLEDLQIEINEQQNDKQIQEEQIEIENKQLQKIIDEKKRIENYKIIQSLKREEEQLKIAQQKRKNIDKYTLNFNISEKLDEIFKDYTTDSEKIQMKSEENESTEDQIDVPVHLAINQCIVKQVKEQFKIVNKCMLHMIYRKSNFLNNLQALKMFYLGSRGDILDLFSSLLFYDNRDSTLKDNSLLYVNNCFDEASKPSQQVNFESIHMNGSPKQYQTNFQFQYLSILEQISKQKKENPKQQSSLQNLRPNLILNLQNLDDFLFLQYKVQFPLNLILTSKSFIKYNQIYFMLLQVKRINQILKFCWLDLSAKSRQINKSKFLSEDLKKDLKMWRGIQIQRSKMHIFIKQFEEYLQTDIIETAWLWLIQKIQKVQVFEELIQIHNQYLEQQIIDKSLFAKKDTLISKLIKETFKIIQKFTYLVRELSNQNQYENLEEDLQKINELSQEFDQNLTFLRKFTKQMSEKGLFRELNSRLIKKQDQQQNI